MRSISTDALGYLIRREGGLRYTVYDDGFGYPTVGLGHLVVDADKLKIGDEISVERAITFLIDDLQEAIEAVDNQRLALEQHQFDALVIFCFNIGVGAFRRSTLVRRLKHATPSTRCTIVEEELPRWKKVGGVDVVGLYNRRIDTIQMFCKADYNVDWQGLQGQIQGDPR